jgi:esterase/lipase superfamily enzyme
MRRCLLILSSAILLYGCASQPQLNPLQIQAMQTQEFGVTKRQAYNATVTVLQNKGYEIKSANFDTGIVTARSPTNSKMFMGGSYNTISAYVTSTRKSGKNISQIRISDMLTRELPETDTSLLVGSFISTRRNINTKDEQVLDPEFYKEIFNEIRQQLFVADSL